MDYMALGRLVQTGRNPEKNVGWAGLAEPGWLELGQVAPNWVESHLNTLCAVPSVTYDKKLQCCGWLPGWLALAGLLVGWLTGWPAGADWLAGYAAG